IAANVQTLTPFRSAHELPLISKPKSKRRVTHMLRLPAINQDLLTITDKKPCISLYLSTGAATHDPNLGRIRLKNLLKEAKQKASEQGVRDVDMPNEELKELEARARDEEFRGGGGRGLAVFVAPGIYEFYPLHEEIEEGVTVSDRFHVRPLMPYICD